MTTTRRLFLAAAAALPLALAACDNTCPMTNPDIAAGGVPTCTGAKAVQAGAAVTVKLNVCPRCDQAYDSCTVTLPTSSAIDQIIQLDPLVQVCSPNNSCPFPVPPESCAVVSCTFTAPAAGSYQLLVNDPDAGVLQPPFEVVASGGQTTCAG
jgi:hypothetical protein